MLDPSLRLAIYMEGAVLGPAGKMGFGVLRYSPNPVVCVVDSQTAGKSAAEVTGIDRDCPVVASIEEAHALGAEVLVLGIAPPGGLIPASWWPMIDKATALGFSLVNGLHDLIGPKYPQLARAPQRDRQFVWDIRIEPQGIGPGTGAAAQLDAKRLLLIGTDMAVGKMTAGLEIAKETRKQGVKTGFVATGQIGITITGSGIPLDAIRVDFASGAVQREVIRHAEEGAGLIVVEGQGSLIHPGSTANLPLLRGSCPTHLVLCHRAGQEHLLNLPQYRIPGLAQFIEMYEDLAEACGTFARPKTVCVALNTSHLGKREADEACRQIEEELGLPCADPIRHGASRLAEAIV
jgi:uncharacterized NAD-dependent epimerase/dehydratase family protein